MQKALVVGMGRSGRGAYKWLTQKGWEVTGLDKNPEKVRQSGMAAISDETDLSRASFDIVVPSPGIPISHKAIVQAVRKGAEVVGELELGLRSVQGCVIGITGTNGKTTMTLFLEHLFNQEGKKAVALGNVGYSLCEFLSEYPEDTSLKIIEMSSFQLETLKTKALDVALITSFSKDHLDRHKTMGAYARAKLNIGACVKEGGQVFCDPQAQAMLTQHAPLARTGLLLPVAAVKGIALPTSFFTLSYTVAQHFGIPYERWERAVTSFKRPEHRLEFVGEVEGIEVYNDSKATNEEALSFALDYFASKPVILILGGQDKGLDFTYVAGVVAKAKCRVVAYGAAGPKLYDMLENRVEVFLEKAFAEAVEKSLALGRKGDVVLLSPACTSFDQFSNFEKRGESFKQMIYQCRSV